MRRTFKYQTLLLAAGLVLTPPTHAQFGGGAGAGGGSGGLGGGSFGGGAGPGGRSIGGGGVPPSPPGVPGGNQMPSPGTGTPTSPGGGNPCGSSAQCGSGTSGGGNTGGGTHGGGSPSDGSSGVGGGGAKPSPSGAGAAAPASGPTESELRVTNKCDKSFRIAIEFRDASLTWTTWGWWTFEPGQSSFVSYDGRRLRSNNSVFYFYATGDGLEWKGESPGTVDGKDYKFRKIKLPVKPDDTFELALTCSG